MPTYILLLHESAQPTEGLGPEEIQAVIERYKAWSENVGRAGRLVGGEKLADGVGRVMEAGQGGRPAVTDGPYAESKEVVAGYFLVRAASYEDAVELARDCPHLDFGRIEIRRIEPT
jgi:hypothetical protein